MEILASAGFKPRNYKAYLTANRLTTGTRQQSTFTPMPTEIVALEVFLDNLSGSEFWSLD